MSQRASFYVTAARKLARIHRCSLDTRTLLSWMEMKNRRIRRVNVREKRMTLFDMSGNVPFIPDSSPGSGPAIAHRTAEHSAKAVISPRDQKACDQLGQAITHTACEPAAL